MTARSPGAFALSTLLHGGIVVVILLFTYVIQQQPRETTKVFELVAGEGDNFAATEAPALGEPDGIKLSITSPAPSQPGPTPIIETPAPEPVIEPAPPPMEKVTPPVETKTPNFAEDVQRIANKRERRLEAKYRKQREAAERAREAAEKKAREEAAKQNRISKAEFDKMNRSRKSPAPSGTSSPKVAKIDAEGIRNGVVGGSTNNKVGGAGGKALRRDDGDEMDAYFALLKQRSREALDKPPGLSDTLTAEVEFHLSASGTISGAKIKRSSGSSEFDAAALQAISRTRMPARPDRKSETLALTFRMRDIADDN